jgi:hypothetical protein
MISASDFMSSAPDHMDADAVDMIDDMRRGNGRNIVGSNAPPPVLARNSGMY